MTTLRPLLLDTRDGEWGKGEPGADRLEMRVIRGTDFDAVRQGEVERVPTRFLERRHADRKRLQPWDIIFETAGGSPGRPTGRSILVTPRTIELLGKDVTCASFARFLRVDPAQADPAYVFWMLQHHYETRDLLAFHTQHTGVARFQYTTFSNSFEFDLPPIETQRRIASILGAYDDLIEVNRRRIAVLEEMARGLFDGFVTNLIGELPPASGGFGNAALPDGWHISDLGDVAEIIMGQSPPSEELNKDDDGFPFHQGVTDFGPLFPRRRIFCVPSSKKKIAATGDILFSVRAPVGRINLATEAVVLGRGVSSFRSTIGTQHYLAAHLRATFYEPDLIGNGAIYKAVGRNDIRRIPITLPPAEIRNELDAKIASMYDLLWVLEQSNNALAAARDLLLPRLTSGQLSVAEAERELEEAA